MTTGATLAEGAALPVIERAMTPERLIMYAGATWDWHRLHYDAGYAADANLPAPIVDGQHFGGIFAEQVLAVAEPRSRVRRMAMRFRSIVFAGETIRVTGTVTTVEDDWGGDGVVAVVSQELLVGERLCATSVTTVALPQPTAQP